MAQKKRKSTSRRRSRRRTRPQERIPAGLGTLFAGLLLTALAFVQGESVWRTLHDTLFGLLGCGALVLGAAVCCLAVLYTRGEDLLPHITKLALGLVLAGRDPFALWVDEKVRTELVRLLLPLKRAERLETLERGACCLADALALEQPAQRRYLTAEARALLPRLTAALEHGDLSGVFFDFAC